MQSDDILKALKSKNLNYSLVADALGDVKPPHVSAVARRKAQSLRVATALAKAIGKTVKTVFPDMPAYHDKPSRNERISQLRKELAA